jgi:large repetitive protein
MSYRIYRASLCVSSVLVAAQLAACQNDDQADAPAAPQVISQEITTDEDTPVVIDVLKDGSNPDGARLTVTLIMVPEQGILQVDGTTIKVTPNQDFHGTFTVNYKVSNGRASTTAHATVTVRPVNDAPVATGGTFPVGPHATITLEGRDVDGDTLTYEIVTPPSHGTLTGTPPTLQYNASTGFLGDDEFVYRVSDAALTSAPVTLHLRVGPNSPPAALPATVSVREDESGTFDLQGSDPDTDPLTFTVVTTPLHGTLSGTAPNLTYQPEPNFVGSDSLAFSVSDGSLSSNTAVITIT